MCNRFQVRRHWVIENEGHWLRHLPLGEDAHRDSVPDAVRALPRLRALTSTRRSLKRTCASQA